MIRSLALKNINAVFAGRDQGRTGGPAWQQLKLNGSNGRLDVGRRQTIFAAVQQIRFVQILQFARHVEDELTLNIFVAKYISVFLLVAVARLPFNESVDSAAGRRDDFADFAVARFADYRKSRVAIGQCCKPPGIDCGHCDWCFLSHNCANWTFDGILIVGQERRHADVEHLPFQHNGHIPNGNLERIERSRHIELDVEQLFLVNIGLAKCSDVDVIDVKSPIFWFLCLEFKK